VAKDGDELFSIVEVEINHACNRRCSYCPVSVAKRKDTGEIDPEIFEKLLAELGQMDFRGRFSFHFYNEPLLHSDLEDVVAKARRFLPGARLELYTNGTLLSRDRLWRLREAGTDHFVITQHEGEDPHPFTSVWNSLDAAARSFVKFQNISEVRLTNRGGLLPHLGSEGLKFSPCFIPSMCVTVTVSGRVLACFEDFNEKLDMGDLRTKSLMEIWNSSAYSNFRASLRKGLRHLHDPCKACNRVESLPPSRGSSS
jgi:radical SAM protein with 4Fe4S-binding SPASM domain